MAVLPRLSVSHKSPRANAAEHGQLCTQTSVATAVGITFTTTVLVFLLATLCLRKLGCCARDREKSTTRDFDGTPPHHVHPSGPDFGRHAVSRVLGTLPPNTSSQHHLPRSNSIQISQPRPGNPQTEPAEQETQQPACSLPSSPIRRQPPLNPLPLVFKDKLAAKFKEASKKALIQDLTRPRNKFLTAAPTHVDITGNPTIRYGPSSAIVHPLEVEHSLNRLYFPQFNDASLDQDPKVSMESPGVVVRPLRPAQNFWNVPIEMEAEESQFDPLNGPAIFSINNIPHHWGPSPRSDRRFSKAKNDVVENCRRCRCPARDAPEISGHDSGISRQTDAKYSSAAFRGSEVLLQNRSKGKGPAMVSTNETRCYQIYSVEPNTDHGYYLDHTAPSTTDTSQDERDPTGDSLYAEPSYIPTTSDEQIAQSLPSASTGSPVTDNGTEASSWSKSPATFSTASSISVCDQPKTVARWSHEACTTSSTSSPVGKPFDGIVIVQKYACPICSSNFRTPGLLSTHYNRKHNPRYQCEICKAAFGLWKDLERHTHTVHVDRFGPLRMFTCPNVGCGTPGKRFIRKDNFQRHFERCRQGLAAESMAHEQVQ